jgi:glyoxylase I family protein
MTGHFPLVHVLRTLEERLLLPQTRKDSAALDELLDDGFVEFGASGRVYDKRHTMETLRTEALLRRTIADFRAVLLAPGTALVTYRLLREDASGGRPAVSLRSSVWRERNGRWRLVFHQGTTAELS